MEEKNSPKELVSPYKKWAVIMAGGVGERFWPLSTPEHPKQLLPLGNHGNTLISDALERIRLSVSNDNIWVATSAELKPIFSQLHMLPEEQIIAEPSRKNTAGCLAYVVANLLAKYGNSAENIVMAVLTADQLIEPVENFVQTVNSIMDYVAERKVLGIIGIAPTRPDTGFGYIETGNVVHTDESAEIYTVKKFHEKPKQQTAEEYVRTGNYFWNSGMFFWKVQTFLDEIKVTSPVHWNAIIHMAEEIQRNHWDKVNSIFQDLPSISIDYALMERTQNIVMIKGNFCWDDLGSWTSLERTMPRDENGNIVKGNSVIMNTSNSIIYNNQDTVPVTVVSAGVENLVIAVANNVVLVMDKKEAPNLKQIREDVEKYRSKKVKEQ